MKTSEITMPSYADLPEYIAIPRRDADEHLIDALKMALKNSGKPSAGLREICLMTRGWSMDTTFNVISRLVTAKVVQTKGKSRWFV